MKLKWGELRCRYSQWNESSSWWRCHRFNHSDLRASALPLPNSLAKCAFSARTIDGFNQIRQSNEWEKGNVMRQLIANLLAKNTNRIEHISQSNLRHEHWTAKSLIKLHASSPSSSAFSAFISSVPTVAVRYLRAWIYGCRACDWWVFAELVVPATRAKFNWIERNARIRVCVCGSMHRERRTFAVGLVDWIMVAWHGRL